MFERGALSTVGIRIIMQDKPMSLAVKIRAIMVHRQTHTRTHTRTDRELLIG